MPAHTRRLQKVRNALLMLIDVVDGLLDRKPKESV